tara:strand:- start:345 stop:590 length:246 start_codon:yes stop_codon:yes gene_type:complete
MEYVDEENNIKFEIKTRPNKNGHSTIKKLLMYLETSDDVNEKTITCIKQWNKVLHTRNEEDVKLYIKSMKRRSSSKKAEIK